MRHRMPLALSTSRMGIPVIAPATLAAPVLLSLANTPPVQGTAILAIDPPDKVVPVRVAIPVASSSTSLLCTWPARTRCLRLRSPAWGSAAAAQLAAPHLRACLRRGGPGGRDPAPPASRGCVTAVAAGASVKDVQRMLGHASAAMTLDVYASLFEDGLNAVSDRMNAACAAGLAARADSLRTTAPVVSLAGRSASG